jgi:glycosyltransferase involved in cell wall biosynthesis
MTIVSADMISIITPVYNSKRFIEFCIKNVIDQNCPAVEHIIIDGGSSDGTVEIIRQYAEKYPHIRWISEKDNGQSDAMNKGIAMARGEIIGILNVDDYYEPNVLCRIHKILKALPEPTLLVGNCNVWDNEGNLWFVSRPAKISLTNLLLERFMESFPMNPSAYFYHASLHRKIWGYKTDEHFGMDLDFILKAVQSANVKYINETWGNYRYLVGTKTYNADKSGENSRRVKAIVKEHRKKMPAFRQLKISLLYEFYRIWGGIKYQYGRLLKRPV